MSPKRGLLVLSDPAAIIALAIVLVLFGFFFYTGEIFSGKDITIPVERNYISSSRIVTLLKTPVKIDLDGDEIEENVEISDILSLKHTDEPTQFDTGARREITRILEKLPKPAAEGVNGWNLAISRHPEENEQEYITTALDLSGEKWLSQSVLIPTETPERPLLVRLYLVCNRCTDEDMEGFT